MGILSLFRRQKSATPKAADAPVSDASAPKAAEAVEQKQAVVHDVHPALVAPVITEKAALLSETGQYVFRIASQSTKQDVRRAVEEQYKVHVTGVRTLSVRPKTRIRGRIVGEVPGFRKAIVTIREGERIDLTGDVR